MEFNKNIFCKNVTKLRKLKGYTKYQASIQSDIYYQYYCNIENGVVTPNFKNIISIANALNTNISSLIGVNTDLDESKVIRDSIISMIKEIDNADLLNKFYKFILIIKIWKCSEND